MWSVCVFCCTWLFSYILRLGRVTAVGLLFFSVASWRTAYRQMWSVCVFCCTWLFSYILRLGRVTAVGLLFFSVASWRTAYRRCEVAPSWSGPPFTVYLLGSRFCFRVVFSFVLLHRAHLSRNYGYLGQLMISERVFSGFLVLVLVLCYQ